MDKMIPESYSELETILERLTSTQMGRRTFLASVPLLMAACASSDKHRMREGDNSGQRTEMTVDDERRMAEAAVKDMRTDYPPLQDPELQTYVSGVGKKLALANGLEGRPYTYSFTVVDTNQVNAFALPAGTVFVTAPLLAMTDTEAELAGVLGHEIGHVKARHTAERMERAKSSNKESLLYGAGGGLLGGGAGFGLGKIFCPPSDNDCVAKAAVAGAAVGVGGALLIQKYKFMANSREDEMEADRIAFRTSIQAGYSKEYVGRFYAKLQKMEEASRSGGTPVLASLNDAISTHPPSKERVAQMTSLVQGEHMNPKSQVTTRGFEIARKRAEQYVKNKTMKI